MVGLFFLVPPVLIGWMSLHRRPLVDKPTLNAPYNYTGIVDNFLRTAFFLPVAVGFASASLLFLGLLSDEIGPVNDLLSRLGLIDGYVSWTSGSAGPALGSAVVLVLWRFAGFTVLILLTGLQAIPVDVYEAARIDGANRWQIFRRITVPLMRPTFALDLGSAAGISVALPAVLLVFNAVQFVVLRRPGSGCGLHGRALPGAVRLPAAQLLARLHLRRTERLSSLRPRSINGDTTVEEHHPHRLGRRPHRERPGHGPGHPC
ncbi:MAG: sugar ABC transporter permease [Umezawaea sp.]